MGNQTKTEVQAQVQRFIRKWMSPPTWKGVDRGVYEVGLRIEGVRPIEIGIKDAVMVRQVGRLLQRIIESNQRSLERITDSSDPHIILTEAWEAIEQARGVAYCAGERDILRGAYVVAFTLSEWDADLLNRYDDLLLAVYNRNRELFDKHIGGQDDL